MATEAQELLRTGASVVGMFGTSAHCLEPDAVWNSIQEAIASRSPLTVLSVNVHWLRLTRDDPALAELSDRFDLRLIDGTPVRWLAESISGRPVRKQSGSDLVPELCRRSAHRGWRLFFLGGGPSVAQSAADAAQAGYPGCRVVGVASPPRKAVEEPLASKALCRAINRSRPDVVLVAFGQPVQEHWIDRHRGDLTAPVLIGVGGSLDLLAGRVPRAPVWMQERGLEWVWRLSREPRRLWRRYLVEDLPLGLAVASAYLRNRKARPGADEASAVRARG